ncbi:unnamed protein product [Strongylus vulgaris]|uniref:Major facilitator superfamily (MFS) profile domain-containing protein n=1 Tax=Strongylus vulgaris TaxID=40348 RepID=A0A3P7J0W1_STRVU|nr:unnamed protein product [Strongylus vulgaris]
MTAHWKTTTALICIYGVFKEFRPATPFLTPYLASHFKNLTLDQIYGEIFPFWTYSYMIFLVPIFILTDIFRYKPIIVLEGACLSLTWGLLVWGQGVLQMQIMQISFGLASASEIAYFSYIYAVVDEKEYRRCTSYIRTAALIGKLLAYGIAQILVTTGTGSYLLLNQISLGAVFIVFFIALALPRVPAQARQEVHSELLAERESRRGQDNSTRFEVERQKLDQGVRHYLITTLKSFQIFKDNFVVLKWSIWWSLTSCGIFQVCWSFVYVLACAVLAFGIQFANIDWIKNGELTLTLSSCLIAIILAAISQCNHVVLAYMGYVCVTAIYHACNIATELSSANYGLVFGWNTFVAVVLQTLLTLLVVDSHGFNLKMRTQFVVYALYFAAVGVLFLAALIYSRFKKTPDDKSTDVTQANNTDNNNDN